MINFVSVMPSLIKEKGKTSLVYNISIDQDNVPIILSSSEKYVGEIFVDAEKYCHLKVITIYEI